MIEETRWLCEYCRKPFNSKKECLEHEKSHNIPVKIIERFYSGVAHPATEIHVMCEDGTVLEYEYSKPIRHPLVQKED